ncbi:MAG: Gfo/Idh/MocA family oxidoreductase [Sphingomonas taxi]
MLSDPPLRQAWPMPGRPRPIVVIGPGGIVRDAHLPAYRKAGFTVAGLYDHDRARAEALAAEWGIAQVYASLDEAVAADAVFDIAAPPVAHAELLEALPPGAVALIQKPFGRDLAMATRLRDLAAARGQTVAVNFQLRFSPMMLALRDAMARGHFGTLTEIEVHLNLVTPWHLFPHLKADGRVEIVSHSIHYLDAICALVGLPQGVFARSYGHPDSELAPTRTSAILDYGAMLRVTLSINHHHDFGRRFQDAAIRVEGDAGAAMLKLGLLLDYPTGEPDELWLARRGGDWSQVPLAGGWFPDAFIGPMANLQRFAAGEDPVLETAAANAWATMALVEACYASMAQPGTPLPTD